MGTAVLLVLGLAIIGNVFLADWLMWSRRRRPVLAGVIGAVLLFFCWTPPVQVWALVYTPYALIQARRHQLTA